MRSSAATTAKIPTANFGRNGKTGKTLQIKKAMALLRPAGDSGCWVLYKRHRNLGARTQPSHQAGKYDGRREVCSTLIPDSHSLSLQGGSHCAWPGGYGREYYLRGRGACVNSRTLLYDPWNLLTTVSTPARKRWPQLLRIATQFTLRKSPICPIRTSLTRTFPTGIHPTVAEFELQGLGSP